MPHYLSQVSYTPEAWARLVANPHDRIEAVRGPIEKLGVQGQLKLADAYRDGRLGDVQMLRRGAEAPQPCDPVQGFELPEVGAHYEIILFTYIARFQ